MKKIFIVSTHVANSPSGDVAGGAHSLVEFLEQKNQNYVFIKHPIYGKYPSEIMTSINDLKTSVKRINFWEFTFFRYLAEGVVSLLEVIKYHRYKIIYIGVDPLNCFWGLLGKKLGLVKTFIFFSPDYSQKRFDNGLINKVYHLIDEISAKRADFVWSVSPRISDIRLRMGIAEWKNFIVPNAPFFKKIPKANKTRDSDIVMVANISRGVNLAVLLKALTILKNKGKIYKLKIIGTGEGVVNLKNEIDKLKLNKQIILQGRMEHDEVYQELLISRIGVAFYNKEENWTYFCDPMKVRDYLACGLPVIMNDVPFITKDIEKFSLGIVLKNVDELKLAKSIESILGNQEKYDRFSHNATVYAKKYDLEKILEEIFMKCNLLKGC